MMKRNDPISTRLNPAYNRAMEDIAEETNENKSFHLRQACKMYIASFDDIIDSEIIDKIDRELDAYIDARAENNLLEMLNHRVSVERKKHTTIIYVDDILASMYYSLSRHNRLDEEEIEERLRKTIEPLETRSELVQDTKAFEKRLEEPIKYAQNRIENTDYNEYED